MTTKIEWVKNADGSKGETWNPVTGCTKVSAGCEHCYAERMSKRLRGRHGYPADDPFAVTLHPDRLEQPLRWRKPRRVFVASMGDLFHEDVPDEFIVVVFGIMAACPEHTFQVLTKRPKRMREWFERMFGEWRFGWEAHGRCIYGVRQHTLQDVPYPEAAPWPLPNVWLGTSVEDQPAVIERLPHLFQCPAAVRIVSCEPLLGAIDFDNVCIPEIAGEINGRPLKRVEGGSRIMALRGERISDIGLGYDIPQLDWVIVGGESGPGARPMHPDWARSLRDQCQAAGVPFFFKQWGAWQPQEHGYYDDVFMDPDGAYEAIPEGVDCSPMSERMVAIRKVGKKHAGRVLDGREWNEMPGDSRGTE